MIRINTLRNTFSSAHTKLFPRFKHSIGVIKEISANEKRVAAVPDTVSKYIKSGYSVSVESGAGVASSFKDCDYEKAGAVIVDSTEAWKQDTVLKILPPTFDELALLENRKIISTMWPAKNTYVFSQLAKQKATVIALDCIPRTISRGQSFDVLSSQANLAGYRAMIEAQHEFGRLLAGQMTAAGKTPPAKVLVLGTGVAGLAAIQTAKNSGAIVRAFDVRPVTKEQVQSMGATFIEIDNGEDGSGSGHTM